MKDFFKIGERIKQFRKGKKLTQQEFGRMIGVSEPLIAQIENGKRGVSVRVQKKLMSVFGLSSDYILYGRPPDRPKPELKEVVFLSEKLKETMYQTEGSNFTENYVAIPIAKGRISAGTPREVEEDPDGIAIIYKEWAKNKNDFTAIRVKGSSMEPCIQDGSLVGIDHSQRDAKALNGKIVAIRKGNEATIKRLRIIGKDLMIGQPDNPEWTHETVALRGKEMNNAIIGKVVWWWGKQD
jgi:SOS-response transcriptional repressor LexA